MNSHRCRVLVCMAALSAIGVAETVPVSGQRAPADDWCGQQSWSHDRAGVCEVRELTVAAGAATLAVDATPNGGIRVTGGPRSDVLVRARIVASADSEQRAGAIAAAVRVEATPDRISATGPNGQGRRESWSVSYEVAVPTHTSLSLRTTNGGIVIAGVESRIDFRTVNGGVKLSGLAGEVTGATTNGGIDVDLDGFTWSGGGLNVQTNNGGIKLQIPEQYSARLETATINGRFDIDFPITVQGRINREIVADLGAGGPLIRVRTHNGGVRIMRK